MLTITFTASVVRKDKGCYIAHAEEFPITAEPASTQRGAIKNLKRAVLLRMQEAAESGALTRLLDDAGYAAELIGLRDIKLEPNILSSETVSVPLSIEVSRLDRANGRATGEEGRAS